MRKRKIAALLGTAVLAVSLFTGCGTKSTMADSGANTGITDQTEGAYTVKVVAVEDNQIKAQVGEISGERGAHGEAPEKPDGTGSENEEVPEKLEGAGSETGEVPEKPGETGEEFKMTDGEIPAQNIEGMQPPENGKGGFGGFMAGDEEITFTVTDETKITVESMPDRQGAKGEKPETLQPVGTDTGQNGNGPEDAGANESDKDNEQNGNEKRKPLMETTEGTLEDITVDSILLVTLDEDNAATAVTVKSMRTGLGFGKGSDNFGGSDTVTNGTAATTVSEDTSIQGKTYQSSGDDENALRIDGSTVELDGINVNKSGGSSSNTENGDFYGQNAGLLALNGAAVTIKDAEVNTSAVNGNGVFSYGEGTTVNISDSTIQTTENNSGGIQTTGGGTMKAKNLTVETMGNSAAAIRSDRGGGTVEVEGGSYTSNGTGSPAVYSTADITVSDATLTANASEGVVVEGKNSVTLKDCVVISNMENTYNGDEDENIHGIMIYQSMSGDADVGEADFSAEGGIITAKQGDMIYVTNTACTINLQNVQIELANDTLLRIEGNDSSRGWGTQGENGGAVTMTASDQILDGNILVDDISSLSLTMSDNTTFEGAINPDGEGGKVNVILSSDSSWTLTSNTYITEFDGDTGNINTNGHHLYVNGEQML